MDLRGPGRSTRAIVLFFLIIFPLLGIVAEVVNRPHWNEADWKRELKNFELKYPPVGIVADVGPIPIPELIDCALNLPKKSATCSDRFRRALLNEVLLRKQFKDYEEHCNSFGTEESELILNAPIQKEKRRTDYPLYFIWQEKLINSKVELCDPHAFLRCSAERKCVCLSGTVRVENGCVYSHGTPCTGSRRFIFDFQLQPDKASSGQLYFDPFDRTDPDTSSFAEEILSKLEVPIAPRCQDKNDLCIERFFPSYFREASYCVHVETELGRNGWFEVGNYFQFLLPPPLRLNAKCSFQDHNHNRLFTSTREEDDNYEVRFKTVEEIMIRRVRFCDLEAFLTCGPSENCECMSPSSEKDGKCVLPDQMDKCQINISMVPILTNKTLVPRARIALMKGFVSAMTAKACEQPLKCHADMMEMYCTCPPGSTGVNCGDRLTRFLSIVRVPSLPIDVAGYPKKIETFGRFNKKAIDFEEIFRLGEDDPCHRQILSAGTGRPRK